MTTRRVLGALAATALLISMASPALAATDPKPMGPRMLQQTVLRAQMPTTLGPWQQYLYQTLRNQAPTMCWSMDGAVTLPKAAVVGLVNYQVDQRTSGVVMIYQYANKAAAGKALAALRKMGCSDSAMHPNEAGTLVPAEQGSDFMDATRTSVGASITFEESDGGRSYVDTLTTQRGLAIVQTQVSRFAAGTQTMAQQQDAVDVLGGVNETWHEQVVKAYQAFGVEGTAR